MLGYLLAAGEGVLAGAKERSEVRAGFLVLAAVFV
jgi:hypothetical protein